MSPILVRPVREQLEHDRVIRLLQVKSRRRFDAAINPGNEQNTAVGNAGASLYPDLILFSQDRGRRVQAVVEVETGESVNHLEALAQWANFSKLKAEFHLYVPSGMVEVARRLCDDSQIQVNEIWSYHTVGDEVRFTLVHRLKSAPVVVKSRPSRPPATVRPKARPAAPKARTLRSAKPAARAKTAKKPARAQKRK